MTSPARKTIGILGGLGPESTIAYYSYITRKYYERYADYSYPPILIHSFQFSDFIDSGYVLPDQVTGAIDNLQASGADFVVAACNSVHIVYEQVSKNISIPWISIMDAVGEQVSRQGLRTLGVLGTVFTMGNSFFPDAFAKLGLETIMPDQDDQQTVNKIIFGELVKAQVTDASRSTVLGVIEKLRQRGAQGLVLACTELPFLIREQDVDQPLFDTTAIHARKALDLATQPDN